MTAAEMPRYQSHKQVHALKIEEVRTRPDGTVQITPEKPFLPIEIGNSQKSRFHFKDANGIPDMGYYVVYEDGYVSWSPTAVFESGYTRI